MHAEPVNETQAGAGSAVRLYDPSLAIATFLGSPLAGAILLMVIRTFEEAVARHDKPERVMHDRGAAFWSWRGISRFTALLDELAGA